MRVSHTILTCLLAVLVSCGGGSDSSGPAPSGNTVATVTVSASSASLLVGQAVQFSAEARNSKGELVTAGQATWSVSPTSVATINSNGLVTAIAAGTANVTATISGVNGNLSVGIVDAGVPTTATVAMPGNSFSPFNVTIKQNGSVIFDFPSAAHNVIFASKTGAPQDIQIVANVKVSRTFSVVGTFPYDCTIHPGMSGQVTVK